MVDRVSGPLRPEQESNYELFNCNKFSIRYRLKLPQRLALVLPSGGSSRRGFRAHSFRRLGLVESSVVIFRHYLPEPGLGNLRACCLP
ncbi:hypothetical protein TNCV_3875241 [Trichonephila clavipes]|uniref:Uncharacterized protein n=1 Tax=Trichonephila clavipes TaxID=2585209 RepID=A0A8X6SSR8_TRICX|nr:hypothetical protein TNCV_3875241 [Trichonephila clavipes]